MTTATSSCCAPDPVTPAWPLSTTLVGSAGIGTVALSIGLVISRDTSASVRCSGGNVAGTSTDSSVVGTELVTAPGDRGKSQVTSRNTVTSGSSPPEVASTSILTDSPAMP